MMTNITTSEVRERFISHLVFGKVSTKPQRSGYLIAVYCKFLASVCSFHKEGSPLLVYTK